MKPIYFLGALIVLAFYWMLDLYASFLLNITIAFLLVIATSSLHRLMLRTLRHDIVASVGSTLTLMMLFFAPIVYLIITLAVHITHIKLATIQEDIAKVAVVLETQLPSSLEVVRPYLEELTTHDAIAGYAEYALDMLTTLGAKSATFMMDVLFILAFYFMLLLYGRKIGQYFLDIIPFHPGQTQGLFLSASTTMSIVFYSILATAILEGALFAVVAYAYGFDALLFGILYGFASLVPIVGGALLWVPLALYQIAHGDTASAIVIAVYSIVMISIIADTFVKPLIIKYINIAFVKSKVAPNELLIFFAILAGLSTFGFWGMILGPAITTFFISLLNLYKEIVHTTVKSENDPDRSL
ncbi:MAG: hypothetical protein KU37_06325 [Sulfuricurvum sp. PC08-66]|nr:MAG: hypothetical protein KU37_06325 [Sulfuricurvum sp. PC08-66]